MHMGVNVMMVVYSQPAFTAKAHARPDDEEGGSTVPPPSCSPPWSNERQAGAQRYH